MDQESWDPNASSKSDSESAQSSNPTNRTAVVQKVSQERGQRAQLEAHCAVIVSCVAFDV